MVDAEILLNHKGFGGGKLIGSQAHIQLHPGIGGKIDPFIEHIQERGLFVVKLPVDLRSDIVQIAGLGAPGNDVGVLGGVGSRGVVVVAPGADPELHRRIDGLYRLVYPMHQTVS